MRDFNQDNRSGGARSGNRFGGRDSGRRRFSGRDSDRPSMHQATCSECGKSCEVPFRPSGDKPVYCSSCFENKREMGGNDRFGGRDSGRPSMHQATCDECGKSCEVPFRPSSDKPIFCNNCFKGKRNGNFRSSGGDNNSGMLKDQFDKLNSKLDKILKVLVPAEKIQAEVKEEVKTDVAEIKPEEIVKKAATKKKKLVPKEKIESD